MSQTNTPHQYASTSEARNEYLRTLFSNSKLLSNRPKALIVDDDLFSQRFFRKVLGDRFPDVETLISDNYSDALATLLREGPFDFVILDIFLNGDRTGIEIYQSLEKMQHRPAIIMTSALEPETYRALFEEGLTPPPFLKKPFHPDQCATLVEDTSGIPAARD